MASTSERSPLARAVVVPVDYSENTCVLLEELARIAAR